MTKTCTRCGIEKPESDFWFDKRRGAVRNPCKCCSNKRNNMKEQLKYANNFISRHDVINSYNGKKIPKNIIEFFTDLILLNRTIKRMSKPL